LQTVVDLHVDTLPRISAGEGRFATGEGKLQVDLERCTRGSVRLLLTALYTTDGAPEPWDEGERMRGVRDQEQGLRTVTSPSQLETLQADEVGSLATIENGQSLQGRRDRVEKLHRRGVRIIGLTWNGATDLAEGVMEDRGNGLTRAGREIVGEVKELQMAIDISHLNPEGVRDVAASEVPFLATHSNARALWDHPRNLTDEQIHCVGSCGGIIGINFYPPFLGEKGTVDVGTVVAHIRHVAELIGPEHLGIGSDLDGISLFPEGLRDHGDLHRLTSALESAGFSANEVEGIVGRNFLRWWESWCGT